MEFIFFSTTFLLVAFAIYIASRKEKQRSIQLEEEYKKQYQASYLELVEALSDWLKVLELPKFEEQKKREEAASQLGTVLLERLLIARRPD